MRKNQKAAVLTFGHPDLLCKAEPVKKVDAEIKDLAALMFETMHKERGIGLAGPQIGEKRQLFVIGFEEAGQQYQLTLINPVIEAFYGEEEPFFEGCLSIPGINANVYRPPAILVNALDLHEAPVRFKADGLLARVIQHELDHLNGTLFTDRLQPEEFKAVEQSLKKLNKKTKKKFSLR